MINIYKYISLFQIHSYIENNIVRIGFGFRYLINFCSSLILFILIKIGSAFLDQDRFKQVAILVILMSYMAYFMSQQNI